MRVGLDAQAQLANLDPESGTVPPIVKPPCCTKRRAASIALNVFSTVAGLSMLGYSFAITKGYHGDDDPQAKITAGGVVLMMAGTFLGCGPTLWHLTKKLF